MCLGEVNSRCFRFALFGPETIRKCAGVWQTHTLTHKDGRLLLESIVVTIMRELVRGACLIQPFPICKFFACSLKERYYF